MVSGGVEIEEDCLYIWEDDIVLSSPFQVPTTKCQISNSANFKFAPDP